MIRSVHVVLAIAFVAGVVVQVFLAGLGVFDDPATFAVHATWGYILELLVVALIVLAVVGRLGRRQVGYAVALLGMFFLQSVFIVMRADYPVVAALHPVNGFGILLVGIVTARDAWTARAVGRHATRVAGAVAATE